MITKICPNLVLPEEILSDLLERKEDIESICVGVKYKDRVYDIHWTTMDSAEVLLLAEIMKARVMAGVEA